MQALITIIFIIWNECHLFPPSPSLVLTSTFLSGPQWYEGKQHSFSFLRTGYPDVEGDRTRSTALEASLQIPGNFVGLAQHYKLAAAWKIEVMFYIGLHWGIAMHSQQSSLAVRSSPGPHFTISFYTIYSART